MSRILLAVLGLLAVANAEGLAGRIINGGNAQPGEIPYQVSLQLFRTKFHFCGGSILNNYYVITAAHCVVTKKVNDVAVIAGTLDLRRPQSIHFAMKFILHEDYRPWDSYRNDIALIRVGQPFVRSRTVSFVPLPDARFVVRPNEVATVSGWGRLAREGPSPKHLQRADIFIADPSYCKKVYGDDGRNIYNTHICAHDRQVSRGSCKGDSGGPLTVRGKLVGLVSWSKLCSSTVYPTIYTRVTSYLPWIRKHAV